MSDQHLLANNALKRCLAFGFLMLTGGPLPAWIGSKQSSPVPDPGADRSIPSLVVADDLLPPDNSEPFAP